MKSITGKFAALILTVFALADPLIALEAPALKARVNDYAGILSPQTISILEAKLEEIEKSDSTQIAVLTIPSLEGDAIEPFSIRVAEKWQIGQKKLDNGVILLISKNDRKVRIETGYGLEGKLTDLVSGRIIRNIIIPNFKNNNFDQGVLDAVDAIISVVRGEFKADGSAGGRKKSFLSGNGLFFLFFLLFFIAIVGSMKKIFGGIMGAVVFPVAGLFTLPFTAWLLALIPVGFLAGLALPAILSLIGMGHGGGWSNRGGGGGFFIGGGGGSDGGFSSGGFGGGGGGSFGGGGASGDW
ncbi:MAG: TPM domain-containing protein [Spirochaetota bacterium]